MRTTTTKPPEGVSRQLRHRVQSFTSGDQLLSFETVAYPVGTPEQVLDFRVSLEQLDVRGEFPPEQ